MIDDKCIDCTGRDKNCLDCNREGCTDCKLGYYWDIGQFYKCKDNNCLKCVENQCLGCDKVYYKDPNNASKCLSCNNTP